MWEWKPIKPEDNSIIKKVNNLNDYVYNRTLGDEGLKAAWHAYQEKKKGFDLLRYGVMTNKGTHNSVFTHHVKPYQQVTFNGEQYVALLGEDVYGKAPLSVCQLYESVNGYLNYFICHDIGTNDKRLYWALLEKRPTNSFINFDYSHFSIRTPYGGTIDFYIPHFAYCDLQFMSEHPGLLDFPIGGSIFDFPLNAKYQHKQWYHDFEHFLKNRLHISVNESNPSSRCAHNFQILQFRPYDLKEYQTLKRLFASYYHDTKPRATLWQLFTNTKKPFDHS